jgi:hypothetical protein
LDPETDFGYSDVLAQLASPSEDARKDLPVFDSEIEFVVLCGAEDSLGASPGLEVYLGQIALICEAALNLRNLVSWLEFPFDFDAGHVPAKLSFDSSLLN